MGCGVAFSFDTAAARKFMINDLDLLFPHKKCAILRWVTNRRFLERCHYSDLRFGCRSQLRH